MKSLFFFLILIFPLFKIMSRPSDFQVWNADTINIHLTRHTIIEGQTEFRYRQNATQLYYKHYQGRMTFIRSPYCLIIPGYRQMYLRNSNQWQKEYHPMLDITLQTQPQNQWMVSNRSRIVYRIVERQKNLWRYRNRFEILTPLRLTSYGIIPYFSEEFFWDESRGIDQTRFIIGLKIPYHKKTQLDLFYMFRFIQNIEKCWIQQNILGVYFSLYF